jgi:hypothetical protein
LFPTHSAYFPFGRSFETADGVLNLAFDRVVLALRLQLGVPDCLADHLLDCPFDWLCLSDDPLQGIVFVALIVGSYLWMKEHSDRANQPMLPVVRGDDRNALYLASQNRQQRMLGSPNGPEPPPPRVPERATHCWSHSG